jgi:hypothetical protein
MHHKRQHTQPDDEPLPPPIYTGHVYPPDEGSSAPFMDRNLLKRPARKQVNSMTYVEDHASDGQDYNIWYHKRPGYRRENFDDRENPATRCNILNDAGKNKAAKNAPFCVYFAQGRCALGPDCSFHHRLPTYEDEARMDLAHDVFGRERFSTDREDMGGVGNFSRENRTLYIGCIKVTGNTEEIVKKHFEEWGPIEYVRIIHTKSIAFVRYFLRATAEFAKEAMNNQALDHGEVINLRWATEDSNPTARLYEERRSHRTATTALNKRLKMMGPAEHSTLYYDITGEYPNTETQYNVTETDGSAYQYEYTYPSSDHTELHPYAIMNAARETHGQANTHSYAGYDMHFNSFAPTYYTVERELAQQEEEEERLQPGAESAPSLPVFDTPADIAHSPRAEYSAAQDSDPYYNNQPLQFSKV